MATMTARGSGASATSADIGTPSTMTTRGCGGAHVSARSSSTPLGVRPPLLTTPTRASATWR